MVLSSGQILNDRYRIERLLGEGGFGAVYLAWDANLDHWVAIKESRDLFAAAYDRSVRLWRTADGAALMTLVGHKSAVSGVVFSPDGYLLATGSWDGSIRLWGIP